MELKPYQKRVIRDLESYCSYLRQYGQPGKAFNAYWSDKAGAYNPLTGEGMRPYQENVPGSVQLCIKVPTAGGKTFLACHALRTIFDALPQRKTRAVVWLVPWGNLLEQTVKSLSSPGHPYARALNQLFNHRVTVYEKEELLQGAGFNPSVVQEQLSIMVMSFSSIRTKNKEGRRVFEQNGALAGFAMSSNTSYRLEAADETSLINSIRSMNPVVIVDESHNAESPLSVEMLKDLNPSFILDLTATPKENANIVSIVPAIELKREHMVKLPVIVYNQHDKGGVIESALHLRKRLETIAEEKEKAGGRYIRPIVLFQAQPKTKEDHTTFEKLKAELIREGVPEAEIRIKTATINEIKGTDLMDRDCPVRYIITVNALKEGWDCPFAYILASLADRSSDVDVTQILGRVLRQPYVTQHSDPLLNLSYVITASAKFSETLQNIIRGLQESGFSEKDYRSCDEPAPAGETHAIVPVTTQAIPVTGPVVTENKPAAYRHTKEAAPSALAAMEAMALALGREEGKALAAYNGSDAPRQLAEMGIKTKQYGMRQEAAALARSVVLPRFVRHIRDDVMRFAFSDDGMELLDRSTLLEGFRLSEKDTGIDFDGLSSEIYKVDLEQTSGDDARPSYLIYEDKAGRHQLIDTILAKPHESRIRDIAHYVVQEIGKICSIHDQHIKKYVSRILENMDTDQLRDFLYRRISYTQKIEQKIHALSDLHAGKQFEEYKEVGIIRTQPLWHFPETIILNATSSDIGRSLYTHEAEMNGLEQRFILQAAGCGNIAFWHRNLGRGKGFSLNGYKADHYPDFIIVTRQGTVILVETKGDDRDNSDSAEKLYLGKAWAELSGRQYKYMMVFDRKTIEGAYTIDKAIDLISKM